ncbi:hypothetical protein AKJ56_01345 [candidate division MSBL1 archaeon SCGC-AAA382N08]|uniref:MCM C-terminal AAA(+) ATPase domain-containing protein n=1 Tax=candidate division MSBL1 archaeon SCGC-AAA382N08 TaxID=1698285 RepID=A0A133VPP5_9EURY|nr:hypothetical protein AKJ56_01345 [candidate division MSBL1 archaeon SCGC-AAA382N08]
MSEEDIIEIEPLDENEIEIESVDENFNEENCRKFYDFLDHNEGYTELRAFGNEEPRRKFVDDEEDFVNFCEKWSGKRDVYAGVNPRKKKGGSNKDVLKIINIPMDWDAVRPNPKETPASEKELETAIEKVKEIADEIKKLGYERPTIDVSGNGCHPIFKIPPINLEEHDLKEIEERLNEFQKQFIKDYNRKGVDPDPVGDPARIIRVWGTRNLKGEGKKFEEDRRNRLAEPLEINSNPDRKLRNYIFSLDIERKETDFEDIDIDEVTIFRNKKGVKLETLRKNDEKLDDLLSEINPYPEKYSSPSEADMATVSKLLYRDFEPNEVAQIIKKYRRREKILNRDDYLQKTISNAKKGLEKKKEEVEEDSELIHEFQVNEKAGEFVIKVENNRLMVSIKDGDGQVIYPETEFEKDFHKKTKKRNELKKELKKTFDLDVKKDESKAMSVVNDLSAFLQEKDLSRYSRYSRYDSDTRGGEEKDSTCMSFKSVSDLLNIIQEKHTHVEQDSETLKGGNGNEDNEGNAKRKVYDLSADDRRTIVEFEAEVSGEEGDIVAYIPKEFQCSKCGATRRNEFLQDDPFQELIARSFGSDSTPPCPDDECDGRMEPIEDKTTWFHVYKFWVQHPLMKQEKFHQRQRQLRVIHPVDQPEEETYGLLHIKGIPEVFEMGDEKRLGVVALDAEPSDFTLQEELDLEEKYLEKFEEIFPQISQEKIDRTLAPQVTGRSLEKEFVALLQHSALFLPNGDFGLLNILFAGDDTTAKTPICQDLHEDLSPVGTEYADENATVAGLVGGAERGKGGWSITWGALARADCGMAITEGLHAFSIEMLARMREALKSKIARVQKIQHAIRPCRSRILGTINTSVRTEYLATKYQAMNHLGLDGGNQMNRIDLSRWHTVLVFSRDDVPEKEIDKHKANMADGFDRSISKDVWKEHVLWTWWKSSDPNSTVIDNGVLSKVRKVLEDWRNKYKFSDLMIFSPKGFDIFYSFIVASAYLHHRVENDKVRVTEEDVEYIEELFENYFENIALGEYEEMRGKELLFAEELVDQLTANQKKLLKSLSEGSKPRSEVAEELAVAPESVSRMLHQQTKYDSTTNERYYSGAELVEGKRPLIKRRGNDYELTEFGWLVVSDHLLSGEINWESLTHTQKDKANILRDTLESFEEDKISEKALITAVAGEAIGEEFVKEWLIREDQRDDSFLTYNKSEGEVIRK